MNLKGHKFVVIQRADFRVLIGGETDDGKIRHLPIIEITCDIHGLVQQSENTKEINNALTAKQFNLPFVIGGKLVIPVSENADGDHLIFGGQILTNHVGE